MHHITLDLNKYTDRYIVGDIHGNWDMLNYALETLGFSGDDFLICVGDTIDRGTQNIECLTYFLFADNVKSVRGNHEDMFIQGVLHNDQQQLMGWIHNGGGWCFDVPKNYLKGLARQAELLMPLAITAVFGDTKVGICHAQSPTPRWQDYVETCGKYHPHDAAAVWNRGRIEQKIGTPILGVDYTVHGHTPNKEVVQKCNQYWIDTGAVFTEGYALTISEMKPEGLVHHRFIRNADERSGFEMVY